MKDGDLRDDMPKRAKRINIIKTTIILLFSVAKQKYYGCFNNINSVARQHINELMVLKLVKTYCLPRLLYGCEIWLVVRFGLLKLRTYRNLM